MKTGGYRNNPSTSDIDLSPQVQDTSGAAGEQKSEITPEPVAPEIQDTSVDIEVTGEFDEPEIKEPVNNTVPDSSLNNQEVSEPVIPAGAAEPEVKEVVEVSDELHLKYLSEKLGREVKSIDELTQPANNPLDSDPYLKELAEWRQKTGRPIEDWVKYQKDYNKVSDIDVAREFLQLQYPEFTPDLIDLEINQKYLVTEDDLDTDAAIKNLELKKIASQGRKELSKLVSDLGKVDPNVLTPEIKQDLDLAKQYKASIQSAAEEDKIYYQNVASTASQLKTIKLDLADGVSLDYKLPDGSNKTLVDRVQNASSWKNEDGSWNPQAIVRDAAIIENFQHMLKLAFEQGKNSGVNDVIAETKNVTLGNRASNESALANRGEGVQIEGLDNYLGRSGMSIVRGRRG